METTNENTNSTNMTEVNNSTATNNSSTLTDSNPPVSENNNTTKESVSSELYSQDYPAIDPHRKRKFTIFASRFMHRQYSRSKDQYENRQAEGLLKDQQHVKRVYQRERRATVTIAIIVAAFLICWLPFSITYLIDTVGSYDLKDTKGFLVIFWLGYCNSAVNPVLYSIFNRDFRLAFKRLLCKRR